MGKGYQYFTRNLNVIISSIQLKLGEKYTKLRSYLWGMIFYLLYYGVESFKFQQEDFDKLLEQSRERNQSLDVTGKLIYCEGTFIQLLEGNEKNVNDIYKSITIDRRLIGTKLIASGEVKDRYFENWSMDFDQISIATINEFENCTHPNVNTYLSTAPAIKLLKLLTK